MRARVGEATLQTGCREWGVHLKWTTCLCLFEKHQLTKLSETTDAQRVYVIVVYPAYQAAEVGVSVTKLKHYSRQMELATYLIYNFIQVFVVKDLNVRWTLLKLMRNLS